MLQYKVSELNLKNKNVLSDNFESLSTIEYKCSSIIELIIVVKLGGEGGRESAVPSSLIKVGSALLPHLMFWKFIFHYSVYICDLQRLSNNTTPINCRYLGTYKIPRY